MNGRIYDPNLGRFLQADPFVQFPKKSQSLNRYTYVLNNPLSYTDPSGYWVTEFTNFVRAIVRLVYSYGSDYQAWGDLVASGIALFKELEGSNNIALPVGSVAGAFSSQTTVIPSRTISGANTQEITEFFTDVTTATIGGTASDQTDRNFAKGANSASFAFASNNEKAEAPLQSERIRIWIGYTETSVGDAYTHPHHAFIYAVDPISGERFGTRAGPGFDKVEGRFSEKASIYAETGIYDENFRDPPSVLHAIQFAGYLDVSLAEFAKRANEFAEFTNRNNVPYLGATSNSNSYAFTFLESLGIRRPEPIVWTPGWRHGAPSPSLSYYPKP